MTKRRRENDDDDGIEHKKQKVLDLQGSTSDVDSQATTSSVQPPLPNPQASRLTKPSCTLNDSQKKPENKSQRIRKLVPPRPWSINPSNPTGPLSAKEHKNFICLTRKTGLGAYMRRCKKLLLNDGYCTIHLSAMGAAIPHLMQLACRLPDILPFPRDEVGVKVTTGSVEVQDEILPDDLDEDAVYRTRCKSTLKVVITVRKSDEQKKGEGEKEVVVEEPEQELPDMEI